MNLRPAGHGSLWPAHGYWLMPSTFCPGWSGSQMKLETFAFEPTGCAPLAEPVSRYACCGVPVLVRQIRVARMGRACSEVLEDPVAELRVREGAGRVFDRARCDDEWCPRAPVVRRPRHVHVADLVLVQVEAADERDVDR